MMLLGKANWWFPKSLDRMLPQLSVEAEDLAAIPGATATIGAGAGAADPDPQLV
jgi:hypothetical protein